MPTVINTNLASLFAQNSLTNAQNNLAQSVQRLSSGLRINSAKDDAAGLAIAQLMQSNINGVSQSIRNMSDATNLLQTADTSLATIQDILLRMKQLSVQGYDGSLSAAQKKNIVTELKDLNAEINATAKRTTFNNINLLGSAQGVDSATGDVFAGQFLTLTQVKDDAAGYIQDQTATSLGGSSTTESATVVFNNLGAGETVTFGGLTYQAGSSGATAAQVGNAFAGLSDGTTASTANDSITQSYEVQTIVFSTNTSGLTGTITLSGLLSDGSNYTGPTVGATASGSTTASAFVSDYNSNANAIFTASASGATVTFTAITLGNKATIGEITDDRSIVAAATTVTSGTTGGSFSAGVFTGWSTDSAAGSNRIFTSTTASANVPDLALANTDTGTVTSISKTQGSSANATTSAEYDIIGDPNSDLYRMLPGTYTFNSNGDQLTLSATINGQYKTQTLTVGKALSDGSKDNETNQDLNFTDFGIRLKLATTVVQGDQDELGADIASLLNNKTIVIAGESAKITNVNVANAQASTSYTFTSDGSGNLTLSYEDEDGNPASETIDLLSVSGSDVDFLQGNTYQIAFKSLGVSMDIYAYQNLDVNDIADMIADLDNFGIGDTGQLYVTQGATSALKFQSGPNSDSFIQINTLNVRTDSNSSDTAMRNLGSRISTLANLNTSDTTDDWQDAFMNLDAATEAAQIYISQERTVLGSQMNRIGYLSTNLTSQSTNLQNSRSSIIDTDFASETAKLTRGQIMQQAATAMLAQANQMPNVVLSLLK